jgi:hypothetical protein
MSRGPKGEKRPADVIGNAIAIAKIATGEIEDITTEDGKNAAAVVGIANSMKASLAFLGKRTRPIRFRKNSSISR